MKIVKNLVSTLRLEEIVYEYAYRITETTFENLKLYGIEVERVDYIKEVVVNIERESIDKISEDIVKVEELHKLVSTNLVSPIHLLDILGSYADRYIEEMNNERAVVYN
ncbi:MAG: DUF6514 family protein [Sarcina sp.]